MDKLVCIAAIAALLGAGACSKTQPTPCLVASLADWFPPNDGPNRT